MATWAEMKYMYMYMYCAAARLRESYISMKYAPIKVSKNQLQQFSIHVLIWSLFN